MFKKNSLIFEFAGTSFYGRFGFILAKFFNKKNPNFITFDGPLAMIIKRDSNLSLKRILAVIYVKLLVIFRKFATRNATGVLAVGNGIIEEFDSKRKYNDKYFAMPLTLFENDEIFIRNYSNNIQIKIGCIDRISPEKGVYELLMAFNYTKNEINNIELHIFGTGPQEELIRDIVKEKKLESAVHFHGFVSHERIMEELKEIDILVNLTKVGDINRTMWEGAAKGCAIIASDMSGVRSFFTNEINAMLVKPENVKDIAKALKLLCEDHEIRYELSKNATILSKKYTNKKVKVLRKNWIMKKINNLAH